MAFKAVDTSSRAVGVVSRAVGMTFKCCRYGIHDKDPNSLEYPLNHIRSKNSRGSAASDRCSDLSHPLLISTSFVLPCVAVLLDAHKNCVRQQELNERQGVLGGGGRRAARRGILEQAELG